MLWIMLEIARTYWDLVETEGTSPLQIPFMKTGFGDCGTDDFKHVKYTIIFLQKSYLTKLHKRYIFMLNAFFWPIFEQ